MDFNKNSLEHVYRLIEEEKFIEAVETYLHKDLSISVNKDGKLVNI